MGTSGCSLCAGGSGFACHAPLDVFTALTCLSGIKGLLPSLPPSLQSLQWHGNANNDIERAQLELADLKVETVLCP